MTFPPLFFLGPSGAGKSAAVTEVTALLADKYGLSVSCINSKVILGNIVLRHVTGLIPNADGHIETDSVTLFNPEWADPTTFQADFTDGRLLNLAHKTIISEAAFQYGQDNGAFFTMAELANGKTVFYDKGEPTRHSISQFADWMDDYGISDTACVLYITSPFDQRVVRNRLRPGRIPDGPFKKLYEFDDLTQADVKRFGDRFAWINNNGIPELEYREQVRNFVNNTLVHWLGIEGNQPPPERNFRQYGLER